MERISSSNPQVPQNRNWRLLTKLEQDRHVHIEPSVNGKAQKTELCPCLSNTRWDWEGGKRNHCFFPQTFADQLYDLKTSAWSGVQEPDEEPCKSFDEAEHLKKKKVQRFCMMLYLLLPCKQNDSRSNLFHPSLGKSRDPCAYGNCRGIDWASHHKQSVELNMLHNLGIPENQINKDRKACETTYLAFR